MATGKIKADIKAGDTVTTKENLIFKIYGSADGYITPIHTSGAASIDPDVSIVGTEVTIQNVDIGIESSFKITSIDQAANEADKSVAYVIPSNDLASELGADLLVWLKNSKDLTNLTNDGTNSSGWLDASGNNRNAVQATVGNQPILNTDGLLFDGSNDVMICSFGTTFNAFEVFFIINNIDIMGPKYIFDFGGTKKVVLRHDGPTKLDLYSYVNTLHVGTTRYIEGQRMVGRFVIDNANSSLDGLPLDIGAVASVTSVAIGGQSNKANCANIALQEVVITNLLTEQQRTTVINRLNGLLA